MHITYTVASAVDKHTVAPTLDRSGLINCTILHTHCPLLQSTPLHLAAGYNRVGIVELLLQQGADVHAKDKGWVTHLPIPPSLL